MSALLNVILQLIEGLIAFDFYENLKSSNRKLKNFLIIIISYLLMCGINLAFEYDSLINTVVLTLFSIGFTKFLYKHNWGFSIFLGFVFCAFVTVSEYMIFTVYSFFTKELLVDILMSNNYAYIVFIIMSKTLLFIMLKFLSLFINKFMLKRETDFLTITFCCILFMSQTLFVVLTKDFSLVHRHHMVIRLTRWIRIIWLWMRKFLIL